MPGFEHARLLGTILPAVRSGNLKEAAMVLQASTLKCYATTPYLVGSWEVSDTGIPDGSVAMLVMEGPLYSWETFRLETLLRRIADNDRICGAVLWINGPGGMANYVDVVARQISDFSKPVAAFVAGYMLSAHYWIGSSTGRIFAASPLCEVGSVGTMASYVSMREYYRQAGIDYRDIYPDTSDLKNRWFRDIEDKDDEGMLKSQLEELHKVFCEAVSANRDIAYDASDPFFRGATFSGSEALRLGYIDQLGTLIDAVQWVVAQSAIQEYRVQNS